MKLMLVNPPDDMVLLMASHASPMPSVEPLGLLYVAAMARERGHDVTVIDACAEGLDSDALWHRIEEAGPDVIGFSALTSNGGFLHTFGKALKKQYPELRVVFGNIHASVYAEPYLRNGCCDAVIHGEGEYVFADLLDAFAGRRSLQSVDSLSFLERGQFVTTSGPAVVTDLAGLGLPARDMVSEKNYPGSNHGYSLYRVRKGKKTKHMFTSRGCINRCSFCVVHHNQRIRLNKVESVVREMEVLIREHDAGYIFFTDPLFTNKKTHLLRLCDEIRSSNLGVKWGCAAHIGFIDETVVRAMEAAGCRDMNFGIESGVDRLLKNVNKRLTIRRTEETLKMVKRHSHIHCIGLFILGIPGETPADTEDTIEFARHLPLDAVQFSVMTPYPGSPFFNELREKEEIDDGVRPDGTIDTRQWLRYSAALTGSGADPVWTAASYTAETLATYEKRAYKRFYLRPRILWKQFRHLQAIEIPPFLASLQQLAFS
ncbi:MAG: radical SAM protein [Pseudomonadota bacterium]